MSINFYLEDAGHSYHIGVISCGYEPLFQVWETPDFTVTNYARIYQLVKRGLYKLYDEYGKPYTWHDFEVKTRLKHKYQRTESVDYRDADGYAWTYKEYS